MTHFKKAARRCPYSPPHAPHYFVPLYAGQQACCTGPVTWEPWKRDKEISARDENSTTKKDQQS